MLILATLNSTFYMSDSKDSNKFSDNRFNLNTFVNSNANIGLFILLFIGVFIVFNDFIFLDKVYLFKDIGSDSVNYTYPWLVQTSEAFSTQGIPSWTFKQGMGQNAYPLSIGDFFLNAVMFLPRNSISYGIAFAEVLKLLLAGYVFCKYLRALRLGSYVSLIGGFLYAFSGYIILGGCWGLFSLEALYAALILYGFEKWLAERQWLWMTIGITLLTFAQPFFLFTHTIFLLIYGSVRYYIVNDNTFRGVFSFALKTFGFALLGVLVSSVQLFPVVLQYIESPRVSGDAGLSSKLKAQDMFAMADDVLRFTTSMRLFSSDMIGTGNNFKGWSNYLEAPLLYCGILSLVSCTQAFTFFSKKQRIAYLILAGVFIIPILFPYFRYAFWAFTGDYYRTFSLIVVLLLLLFGLQSLDLIIKNNKVNLPVLGVTVLFLLFLLFSVSPKYNQAVNSSIRSFAVFLIFAYAVLIWFLGAKSKIKEKAKLVLLILVFIEGVYFSYTTINKRSVITSRELKEKVGYNDYSLEAINFIKKNDKSFYRINKDYGSGPAIHGSINDAKVQDFFGTSSYHSFNQKNYVKFLGELGVIDTKDENATRWAKGLVDRPLLFSMASGKYWLSKRPDGYLKGFGYDSVATFNDVKVYKNRYSVDFGFCYDKVIDAESFKKIGIFQKDLALLKGCVIENEQIELLTQFKPLNLKDTSINFSFQMYDSLTKALNGNVFSISSFHENNIKGSINTSSPKILYFSIPFDEGWKASVNNKEVKLYRLNCGMTGLVTNIGINNIELQFTPRYRNIGFWVSIFSLLLIVSFCIIGRRVKSNQVV